MRITIIGSGYIGDATARALQAADHDITITTTNKDKAERLAELFNTAIIARGSDREAIRTAVSGADIVVVCVAPPRGGDYAECYLETARSVTEALKGRPEVPIIYTGSTSVYGPCNGNIVTEKTPVAPVTEGQRVLVETETTYLSRSEHACILRLAEIYGPGREIATRLKMMQGLSLPGTGDSITNLVHRDDVVGSILHAIAKGLRGVYNVCGDTHVTRKDFYDRICLSEGITPLAWDPSRQSPHGSRRIVDSGEIRRSGYVLTHPEYA